MRVCDVCEHPALCNTLLAQQIPIKHRHRVMTNIADAHVPEVEMLKGGLVLTGQERPEGMTKGFREDLFMHSCRSSSVPL